MSNPILEVRTFICGNRALYGEFKLNGKASETTFRGEAEVTLNLPNGEEQKVPFRFPFEGVAPKTNSGSALLIAVHECFLHWDEHAKRAADAMKAEFMEHIAKAKAAAQASKPVIETPIHDPTLPERHLDRDGNEKPRRRIIT